MLDRERLLARVDHLQRYLRELREIVPPTYEQYTGIEKRRACERLLQLAIEAVTDTCALLVTGLRLGLPAETGDLLKARRGQRRVSIDGGNAETDAGLPQHPGA